MINPLMSMIICLSESSPSIENYIKLINEFYSGFGYHLQIEGEPFKYKDIEEIFKLLKSLNIKDVGVRTSCDVKFEHLEMIKKYDLRSVMFHWEDEDIWGKLRDARKLGISTEVSVIMDDETISKFNEIINICRSNNVDLIVMERGIISKYRNKNNELTTNIDYEKMMKKIVEHNVSNNDIGIALSHCPNKILLHPERNNHVLGGCSAGIVSCAISDNGDIIPCLPLFDVKLGNIENDDIEDIWNNNEILRQLRNRENLCGKCSGCEFREACGGCRAEGYYRGEGLFAEDKTCWKK